MSESKPIVIRARDVWGFNRLLEMVAARTHRSHPAGRPPVGNDEWERRFEKVRVAIERKERSGANYEQVCAYVGMSLSQFRYWNRRMKKKK